MEEPQFVAEDVWSFVEKVEQMLKAEKLSKAKEEEKKNKKKDI